MFFGTMLCCSVGASSLELRSVVQWLYGLFPFLQFLFYWRPDWKSNIFQTLFAYCSNIFRTLFEHFFVHFVNIFFSQQLWYPENSCPNSTKALSSNDSKGGPLKVHEASAMELYWPRNFRYLHLRRVRAMVCNGSKVQELWSHMESQIFHSFPGTVESTFWSSRISKKSFSLFF